MIRKSGNRFSEKIMLERQDKAKCRFNIKVISLWVVIPKVG